MTKIGLISDTHGFLDEKIFTHFKDCDEIWHAGDIGTIETADKLRNFKPLRAVYGNIDNRYLRNEYPLFNRFQIEEKEVLITHIGGYPGNYTTAIKNIIAKEPPDILITGHSHILKIMYDKPHNFLFMNPGAAGNMGFHKIKTLVKFTIDKTTVKDLQIIEIPRNKSMIQ